MKQNLYVICFTLAVACTVFGVDTKVVFGGREWRLSPECRLEGNVLTVTVPKDKAGGLHSARTMVDLSPFETEGFEAMVCVRGEGVTVPPQPYNGVKFMFHYRNKFGGAEQWPGANLPTGDFSWRSAAVQQEKFVGAEGDKGELVLGLQDSSGTVAFDLSTLKITTPRPHWPVTNQNHVAIYTPDVVSRPRMRGVMSPARDMVEDDFKTLKAWGATLLRYQMMRNWHGVNTNQDLDEFDRWLDGKLDNFDKVVLPMAVKYGIKAVLDLHVPPGGRDPSGDMNMFYEVKYADHFVKTWRRIAHRFRGREGLYGYDLINEPSQRLASAPGLDYWSLQCLAAEAVRMEDPITPIIIESNGWDSPTTFRYLSPLRLTNVIYQVHMYSPSDYTHQRVLNTRPWSVAYPNVEKGWDMDQMRSVMRPVREFQFKHKARVYVGEFSAVAWAEGAERYLRDCIDMFEEYGWDWSYHAFREWAGWSVEHEGEDAKSLRPSADNPRKRALLEGFRRGQNKAVRKSFASISHLEPVSARTIRLEWPEGGERPVAVIDFGPDCEGGYPAFMAVDMKGVPIVRASYASHPDGLGDKGDFWYETRATYLGPSVDLPILPASVNRYDLFAVTNAGRYAAPLLQGLVRYVRLTLDKPGTAVTVKGFSLENRGTHATEPVIGSFDCSDTRLAAIWRMSVRTCELSAIPARKEPLHVVSPLKPTCDVWLGPSYAYLADGAKRDRLVWSGDLWWAQRNMYAAYGYDSPYMPGSLRMLAENSTPEGYVQACPYPESHGPLKDGDYGPFASDEFAAWFVPVVWDHILYSGDRALAKELYPKVKALVAYLRAHCRADGIFEQRRETSKHASALDFGESSTYHRSYMNILLWKTYVDAVRLAEWLGDEHMAVAWRTAANQLAASIRRVFWDAEKGRFRGAIEADKFVGEVSGLALAVKFCMAEEAAAIRKTIVRHKHGKFQALFVRGLYEYGYADDAVARIYEHDWDEALDPSWKGSRLTSECMRLRTRGWGDEAHPDTAIAGILMNYVLGVEPTEPGFAKYQVKPQSSMGVTQATGVVPTPWGELHVSWRMEGGKPVVDCHERREKGR